MEIVINKLKELLTDFETYRTEIKSYKQISEAAFQFREENEENI